MNRRGFVAVVLAIQASCAFFFIWEIFSSVLGLPAQPVSWHLRELIEIGAAVGLALGVVLGWVALRNVHREKDAAEESLRRASVAFMDLLEERFAEWGLTPAERDVALFAVKGMTLAEISHLRSTSEGTVKAQTNSIYRKAGVNGRSQLLSLFIEDLMRDDVVSSPAGARRAAAA